MSYIAKWDSLEVGHEINAVDARGGSARYQDLVFGKRNTSFDFEIILDNATTTTTVASAVQVTGFTAGAINLLDDWSDFTIAYKSPTVDGSGGRNKDEYANYVGGCSIDISGNFMIPLASTTVDALTAVLSDTLADQLMTMTVATGAVSMSMNSILKTARWSTKSGDLQRYSLAFASRGTPLSVTAGLFANILTGTGTSSLVSVAIAGVGGGSYSISEAAVTDLTIQVSGGQVQKCTGRMSQAAKAVFTGGS